MQIRHLRALPAPGTSLFDGLDLTLAPGSYTVVCGPTGSGKSTLAMILAGCFRGQLQGEVSGGPVAVVWQDPGSQMCGPNILDEVRLPMDYRNLPAEESTALARNLLHAVGLGHLPEERDPMRLSGGEQQRLALAAALAQAAPVLVLDEATSQLDEKGRRDFLGVLDDISPGLTILVVDHDPSPHLARADRVIVLGPGGRVVADGPGLPEDAEELGIRAPGVPLWHDQPPSHATPSDGWSELELGFATLPRGARVAVVGANGAGKSTLLCSLTRHRDLVRRGVTWLPQRGLNHLFAATVEEELAACGTAHGIEAADLIDVRGRHPLMLSGGQRQRLALASALGGTPHVLALLDEPSYSQDLNGTRSIARMILAGSQERVTLMATHDRLIVDALATHVAHVADGELKDLVER